ncbi:unnamed protein product [Adineta steineri]|uniref:EF-hand domain-containing protein n=1 Tax=Adineta steineri TaxID=433720 RepID=A0A819A2I6_9BILA|nr:unnamed protein product [Adineta steineri]CAF3777942.1 unnamed protein product [Adineta steineri]
MKSFVLFVLVISIHFVYSANQNPGHLKPLGSVGSLINIPELHHEYPSVTKLLTYYIPKSVPTIFRQVLNNDNHYSIWQADEQLESEVYGLSNTNIQVESFKSRQRVEMTFGKFLQQVRRGHLMFADDVPEVLQKYLTVPKPLQCETVLETFLSAVLIINDINTSPLLSNENNDHFHCILRGSQRMVLINTLQYPDVRKILVPEKRHQRGPPVNPDRVDFDLFPSLANIDYHIANLTSGDCLFIPNHWYFQERSLENTITIVYNIKHQQALNIDVNELKTCPEYDPTFTLDQIDWSVERHPQSFKDLIKNLVNTKADGYDKWQEMFSKHLSYDIASDPEASAMFEEFYGIVDVDGNGQVTTSEIEQINGIHQHHITDILYEMAKIINSKRKTSTPKPVKIEDEQSILNDNDNEEHLHLQSYKTDL